MYNITKITNDSLSCCLNQQMGNTKSHIQEHFITLSSAISDHKLHMYVQTDLPLLAEIKN